MNLFDQLRQLPQRSVPVKAAVSNDSLKYRRESHPDFWLEEEIRNANLPPPDFSFWLDAAIILFGLLGAFVGIGGLLLFLFGVPQ